MELFIGSYVDLVLRDGARPGAVRPVHLSCPEQAQTAIAALWSLGELPGIVGNATLRPLYDAWSDRLRHGPPVTLRMPRPENVALVVEHLNGTRRPWTWRQLREQARMLLGAAGLAPGDTVWCSLPWTDPLAWSLTLVGGTVWGLDVRWVDRATVEVMAQDPQAAGFVLATSPPRSLRTEFEETLHWVMPNQGDQASVRTSASGIEQLEFARTDELGAYAVRRRENTEAWETLSGIGFRCEDGQLVLDTPLAPSHRQAVNTGLRATPSGRKSFLHPSEGEMSPAVLRRAARAMAGVDDAECWREGGRLVLAVASRRPAVDIRHIVGRMGAPDLAVLRMGTSLRLPNGAFDRSEALRLLNKQTPQKGANRAVRVDMVKGS